jgi:hypothetical protein
MQIAGSLTAGYISIENIEQDLFSIPTPPLFASTRVLLQQASLTLAAS